MVDLEEKRQRARAYYAANKEAINEKRRAKASNGKQKLLYYSANKEAINEKRRARVAIGKDRDDVNRKRRLAYAGCFS